jgi:phosphate acetyltransferase
MEQLERILKRARGRRMRIVLCESSDARVREAARRAAAGGLAHIILVRDGGESSPPPNQAIQENLEYVDPATSPWLDEFQQTLLALRKRRGMTEEQAAQAVRQPLVFAMLMVRLGYADGSVAGATHTTADVVRNAIQIVGIRPDAKLVSSFFIMLREEPFHASTQAMIFSDCGLVIEPDQDELAEIALAAADSARTLLNVEPRLAMLSFSTSGSAAHREVEKGPNTAARPGRGRRDTAGRRHRAGYRATQSAWLARRRPGKCADFSQSRRRQHRLQAQRKAGPGHRHRPIAARPGQARQRLVPRLLGRRHL